MTCAYIFPAVECRNWHNLFHKHTILKITDSHAIRAHVHTLHTCLVPATARISYRGGALEFSPPPSENLILKTWKFAPQTSSYMQIWYVREFHSYITASYGWFRKGNKKSLFRTQVSVPSTQPVFNSTIPTYLTNQDTILSIFTCDKGTYITICLVQ